MFCCHVMGDNLSCCFFVFFIFFPIAASRALKAICSVVDSRGYRCHFTCRSSNSGNGRLMAVLSFGVNRLFKVHWVLYAS